MADISPSGYTGRNWLVKRVEDWLAGSSARCLLLTGGPGTGKSTFVAHLAHVIRGRVGVPFVQFCQTQRDETLDPLTFVSQLSTWLADNDPSFATALVELGERAVQIRGDARVGEAGAGATVAGVAVTLNVGAVSSRSAFERLIRRPLQAASGVDRPVLVIVDGLDEALTYSYDETLVGLLSHVVTSALSPRMRFLLTCRTGESRVLDLFEVPRIDLVGDAPVDDHDVRDYVVGRLAGRPAATRVGLAERVAAVAAGNFLYARHAVDMLLREPEASEDFAALSLPVGLPEIYRQYLRRELAPSRHDERWRTTFRPLLGLIAVARGAGLRADQLATITGQRRSAVDDTLSACASLLDGDPDRGPVRLYHQSFRDFLLSDEQFRVYPEEAHAAIGRFAIGRLSTEPLGGGEPFAGVDEYAVVHGPVHLHAAGLHDELRQMLTRFDWLSAKLRTAGIVSVLNDFRLAPDDPTAAKIFGVLRLCSHIVGPDPTQLAGQMLARLLDDPAESADSRLHAFLDGAKLWRGTPWLRPVTSSIGQPDGPLLQTLSGHTDRVVAAAITPDGRLAVSAGADATVQVWDIESGRQIQSLAAPSSWGTGMVAVAHDGSHVAVATQDRRVMVFALGNLEPVLSADGGGPVVFSPDGPTVRYVGLDGRLHSHDLNNGSATTSRLPAVDLDDRGNQLYAVTPDGRWIAYRAAETRVGTLRVWDASRDADCATLAGHTDDLVAAAITPDGAFAVTSSMGWDGAVILWDVAASRQVRSFSPYQRSGWDVPEARALAVTPNGRMVAAGYDTGEIKIFDTHGDTSEITLRGHTAGIETVAITPTGAAAITGASDKTVKVWNLQVRPRGPATSTNKPAYECVAVTPDGRLAVTAGMLDYRVVVGMWDLRNGTLLRQFPIAAQTVTAIAVSRRGRRAVIVDTKGGLCVVDLRSRQTFLLSGNGNRGFGYAVALSADGKWAGHAAVGFESVAVRWDLRRWPPSVRSAARLPRMFQGQVAVTPHGETVIWDDRGELTVLELTSPQRLRRLAVDGPDGKPPTAAAVSANGRTAVLAYGNPSYESSRYHLKTWSLDEGRQTHTLSGHTDLITSLALTPDGRCVVAASRDHTLTLWDTVTGGRIARFTGERPFTGCAITPDARAVVAADGGSRLHVLQYEPRTATSTTSRS